MGRSSSFVVATHIMTLLAHGQGQSMTSAYIAGSVNTNPVVVRRLLARLREAGLVVSQEGAGGGVKLARPARKITLKEVHMAVESDPLFAMHPQDPNPACPVGNTIQGALESTLTAAEAALMASLAKTTVADLLNRVSESPS